MPADRFLHPRLGHSDKVNLLTDLEFRVWVQYQLTADDFGVMRRSAHTLQAANDHLSNRPKKLIERCLDTLVRCELLLAFDHQSRQYVCQWDWQTFQKVEYPRATFQPKPPAATLALCEDKTQQLFLKYPGGTQKRAPKDSQIIPEDSPKESLPDPDYACAQARETATAHGLRLMASDLERESERKPSAVPRLAGKQRPILKLSRFSVFRWMVEQLIADVGSDFDDMEAWFYELNDRADKAAVVIDDSWTFIRTQTLAEAKRRGLGVAVLAEPSAGKLSTRMADMVAKIAQEG